MAAIFWGVEIEQLRSFSFSIFQTKPRVVKLDLTSTVRKLPEVGFVFRLEQNRGL